MSLPNPSNVVTEQRLSEFYQGILPYLGGSADAGFTPVGSIIAIMGVTAPANYLACDGTVYNIVDYPELANYFYQQFGSKNKFGGNGTTTFAVPDLKGEFLRGTGTNGHANCGSGANVGVHQNPTFIPVYGTTATSDKLYIRGYSDASTTTSTQNGDSSVKRNADKTLTNAQVTNVSLSSTGESFDSISTRPTNTSVLFCIATKNIYLNPSLDYSTDEKIVGTWIDGKPIYQKTFTVSLTANTSTVAHNIPLDTMISAVGTTAAKDGGGQQRPIPFTYYDNSAWNAVAYMNSNSVIVQAGNSFLAKHGVANITCQYTKTTD